MYTCLGKGRKHKTQDYEMELFPFLGLAKEDTKEQREAMKKRGGSMSRAKKRRKLD